MPAKPATQLRCPICRKAVISGDSDFPFCSDRCRTIDLGKWANGEYVIASPVTDDEEQIRSSTPEDMDDDS
jgi:uncharacterized protein